MRKDLKGNCYVASEALYHLLGGKRAGYKPMFMYVDGVPHWFLTYSNRGMLDFFVIDPTVKQFNKEPDYSKAKGKGFLTKRPSKAARQLMKTMVYK